MSEYQEQRIQELKELVEELRNEAYQLRLELDEEYREEYARTPKYVDIIITNQTLYSLKEINMATVTLIDGQSVVGTLGSTRDDNGQVTADPVASGTAVYTSDDTTLGTTLTPSADTLSVTLAVPAGVEAGTVTVSVTATTVGGVTVTGSGVATINAPAVGAPVTVDIDWSTPA